MKNKTVNAPVVIRTPYMQSIMNRTYEGVALQACMQGTIVGAWEKLIADALKRDVANGHSEATEIVESCISSPGPKENALCLKAAYLITSSKIATHDPDDLKWVRFGQ